MGSRSKRPIKALMSHLPYKYRLRWGSSWVFVLLNDGNVFVNISFSRQWLRIMWRRQEIDMFVRDVVEEFNIAKEHLIEGSK